MEAFPSTELRSRETGQWLHQDSVRAVQKFDSFTTIDWMDDELEEHRQRLLKKRNVVSLKDALLQSTRTWLVLAAMGIIIGVIAASLNIITGWLASLRLGHCSSNFYLSHGSCCWEQEGKHCQAWKSYLNFGPVKYIVYVMWLALFSWIAAILVKTYAPAAAGSGISEIKCIVSGFVMKGFLGWWTLAIKSLGLPLAIASGLSLGKEGPSVHYAVAVGNSVAKLFHQYRQSASRAREFLTATSAAGVAVAFGSPMGGVLFAMEEISLVFQLLTLWKSYLCALIAVATLAALNPFRTGQLVLFEVTYDTTWHYFELPLYALLGVFGGVYGIVVSKLNKRVAGFRKKYFVNYAVREVVTLAILTSSFCYFNQFLRFDMTEVMQELFAECLAKSESELCDPKSSKMVLFLSLIFATLARSFLTIITYGCKVPAGIFVPSMAAGATFGRAVGLVVEKIYQNYPDLRLFATCPAEGKCIIPGTYSFIGAGAALSGITHLTVTVAIIMFELTGAVRYIIPTMIAVAVTKFINDKWGQGGIADQMIVFNGLPFIDPKEEFVFHSTVGAAMSSVTVVFTSKDEYTLAEVREILSETPFRGYPVVESESNPLIVGYVSRSDLEHVLSDSNSLQECNFRASPLPHENSLNLIGLINTSPLVVSIDTTLEYLLDIFVRLGPRHVLVEKDGLLAGTITRKDILRYEYTTHELHSPHVDDGADARVWAIFERIGQALRESARLVGLERLAAFI
ncbi:CIC11C00000000113 [Sungouiella intermedia]|uniref:Chloride channel protein n=1 Tax=Sungouiella intermedia TaxID=45354 RepID=A0A1L0BKZ3_9ASCO|nr:CIC11C00000000113 [[Candida] intermedia]